ncbi:hypothetical protein O6H91_07G021200 [Diphasiastrum complanatum]|uniref:Uncharacterized protein n=1 Tax=Diphasiastrum complanatum TaxID=34168 RepID=A0ACC2D2Y5_DIPCM|nr:hypothetical protein O6H91_07G021200 [Diphasiastrum complanatum]
MDLLGAIFIQLMVLLELPALVMTLAMASNSEGNSLFSLKRSLVDHNNALSSWEDDHVSPCEWLFVECDNQQHVTQVNLGEQGLSGTLPHEISNLPYLSILKLQNNSISGSIPIELGNLQQLASLDLSNNNFSGEIPRNLGNLSNILTMLLNNNSFQGGIPTTLTHLPHLQLLDLSYNNLSGSIPSFHTKLKSRALYMTGTNYYIHLALFIVEVYFSFRVDGNPNLCGTKISCLAAPPPFTISRQGPSGRLIAALMTAAVSFVLICPIIGFLSWKHCHRHHKETFFDVVAEDDSEVAFGQLKKYSFRELQVATDNFSDKNVLGQGSFGKVFKGVLINGSVVAVKRLKAGQNCVGGEHAFQTEVEMISLAIHRNLLRLKGFCATPSERILVYPYMKNGCLASYIHNDADLRKQAITWPIRKRIALGAAQGLHYLHDHCNPKIIHRDVKAANVLLDDNFEAVVGDFGFAKLLDNGTSPVTTTICGTPGHIAPEYLSTGKSSEKADVFGYGVMLLELMTGRRAFDLELLSEEVIFLDWVKNLQNEKRLKEIVDSSLGNDYNSKEAEELIEVALLCAQASPMHRPKMAEVVGMLERTGIAEGWEEWQKVEAARRQEMELGPHRISKGLKGYGTSLEAIELTIGR